MTELEIALALTTISAIVGPIIVTKYKYYLESKRKKEDPLGASIKLNSVVDQQLVSLKNELDACRVWVSQFHNGGNFYPTGKSIQKFSIFYEHVKPNVKTVRETFTNLPVSLFNKPMAHLYDDGEILISNYKKDETYGLDSYASETGSKSVYIFALNSPNDEFLGTLGIEYCNRAKQLTEDQLVEARVKAITIGTLLSTYLYQTNKK